LDSALWSLHRFLLRMSGLQGALDSPNPRWEERIIPWRITCREEPLAGAEGGGHFVQVACVQRLWTNDGQHGLNDQIRDNLECEAERGRATTSNFPLGLLGQLDWRITSQRFVPDKKTKPPLWAMLLTDLGPGHPEVNRQAPSKAHEEFFNRFCLLPWCSAPTECSEGHGASTATEPS